MHRGQVKVTVLVYQGNFPFSGWATLIQSNLHHFQLDIKAHVQTQAQRYEDFRSKWWKGDKRLGKERKGEHSLHRDPKAFLPNVYKRERERETQAEYMLVSVCVSTCVCFWPELAGFGAVSWSCGVLADKAMLTNSNYCYLYFFSFYSNSFLLFVSFPLKPKPFPHSLLVLTLSYFWVSAVIFSSKDTYSENTL